jgi:hypothetical protein
MASCWVTRAVNVGLVVCTNSCEGAVGGGLACERVTLWYFRNGAAKNAGLFRFCPRVWHVRNEYKPGLLVRIRADAAVVVDSDSGCVVHRLGWLWRSCTYTSRWQSLKQIRHAEIRKLLYEPSHWYLAEMLTRSLAIITTPQESTRYRSPLHFRESRPFSTSTTFPVSFPPFQPMLSNVLRITVDLRCEQRIALC